MTKKQTWGYEGISQFIKEITEFSSGTLLGGGNIKWNSAQVGVFYNHKTGEIKHFAKNFIDKYGYKLILDRLNKESK